MTLRTELIAFIENLDGFLAAEQARANKQSFVPVIPGQEGSSNQEAGSNGGAHQDKIGRNDACPCGSGKKWKKCGEPNTEEHQKNISNTVMP